MTADTAGQYIRLLRQDPRRDWSLDEVRDRATAMELPIAGNKTKAWFQQVETGKIKARKELREDFAKLFGMTIEQFDKGWMHRTLPIHPREDPGIPVINVTPAGQPMNYTEHGITSRTGYTYIERDAQTQNDELFAVKVVGDSMSPRICEGDYAILWPVPEGYPPDHLEGKVVYVHFREEDTNMLARLHWLDEEDDQFGRRLELRKDNTKHRLRKVWFSELDQLALLVQFRGKS